MTIQYKDLTAGPVEVCRDLCNKLLAHQAQKARFRADILAGMNFENRLKPGFEGAEEKLLVVACDGVTLIGYVFADAETVPEAARNGLPGWAGDLTGGFYPPDMELPAKVGSLSNLYVLPEYRGRGIGEELARRIVEYREEHGPFEAVEDLTEVSGIGQGKLAALEGLVTVEGLT